MSGDFDLADFLPYALNRAAEATSLAFQRQYRERYGMLRTEWRVLFHLGRYGAMTARDICDRAGLHKTKVSRAVAALEAKRFLARAPSARDRRREHLRLTSAGQGAYDELSAAARAYDAQLAEGFSAEEVAVLRRCLARLAEG
ncbi:MarR family winged helix-turn-helix transcriptional regulator [Jannaschia marina]|uniref:MarR family winged helix-turn-helix transcriptional regulator n=1 Tax=Jannaschia marina TaxID=2741674 RepID=UPI002E280143|nr:MarR family transcriptional regulator [Jannaschia marina]